MLNIVFDTATAGSLQLTKEPTTGKYITKTNILCLEFHLDIGYLECGIDSSYRIELPDRLILNGCFTEHLETDFSNTGKTNLKNLANLKRHLQNRKQVRVWYSNAPHALCGFYHLCTLLQSYDVDAYALEAPVPEQSEDGWRFSSGWGSVPQDSFGDYLPRSRLLEKHEINLYAERWNELVRENAPLRAVVSGEARSVGEDYYDRYVEQQLPMEPIKESVLVMNTLDAYPLGVYAFWLELRIQKMIDCGKLVVTEAPDNLRMHRVLQRA